MAKNRRQLLDLALVGVQAQIEALLTEEQEIKAELEDYHQIAEAGAAVPGEKAQVSGRSEARSIAQKKRWAKIKQAKGLGNGEWTPERRKQQGLRMKKMWAKKLKARSATA